MQYTAKKVTQNQVTGNEFPLIGAVTASIDLY